LNIQAKIVKQYKGFLKTPQLFNTEDVLGVKLFRTDEKAYPSAIESLSDELSKHKYLGKRAEYFLLQYLKSSERYSEIFHSIQINDGTATIGEVDVICFDNFHQKWIHIELVYKLYVFVGDLDYDDFTQWIGPNLKDRLDYKIDKLISHQLPMGKHPDILDKIGSGTIESYCCFKAKLFLNSKQEQFKFKSQYLNTNCIYGHYVNFEDFKTSKYDKALFYVPEKADWVCKSEENRQWYGFDKAKALLQPSLKDKRARLVWQKTASGKILEYVVVWW